MKLSVKAIYMVHDWDKLMESPVMKIGRRKIADVKEESNMIKTG